MAIAGEQLYFLPVEEGEQAVAIESNFMKPFVALRRSVDECG
jgi:hypothetical protein